MLPLLRLPQPLHADEMLIHHSCERRHHEPRAVLFHQFVGDELRQHGFHAPHHHAVDSVEVGLPPLSEQHRIVTKVDALMALCDALESRLKERAGGQSKFTDAVVKNIGTG